MKVGVKDTRERILSLRTLKTHQYLPTLGVCDIDKSATGDGWTGGV